jgi:hypothetical protein
MTYSTLYSGCCINLTNIIDSDLEIWVKWLNDSNLTTNLQSVTTGALHTITTQKKYIKDEIKKGRIFLVARNFENLPFGILSLTNINYSSAHFTIFFGSASRDKPLLPLEATALLTHYAFEELKIRRLEGGTRINGLKGYVNRLSIIGFLPDGLKIDSWVRDDRVEPTIQFSITRLFFEELCSRRGGYLWPSDDYIKRLLETFKELSTRSFNYISDQYIESITELNNTHKSLLLDADDITTQKLG